jgi:hypothetical protein
LRSGSDHSPGFCLEEGSRPSKRRTRRIGFEKPEEAEEASQAEARASQESPNPEPADDLELDEPMAPALLREAPRRLVPLF